MIDHIGNYQKSAQLGLPIYRLRGGAGYVWAASWGDNGRGTLRFLAIDGSALASPIAVSANNQSAERTDVGSAKEDVSSDQALPDAAAEKAAKEKAAAEVSEQKKRAELAAEKAIAEAKLAQVEAAEQKKRAEDAAAKLAAVEAERQKSAQLEAARRSEEDAQKTLEREQKQKMIVRTAVICVALLLVGLWTIFIVRSKANKKFASKLGTDSRK